nr:hypothetical protein [Tanacetum cinerariifolium]
MVVVTRVGDDESGGSGGVNDGGGRNLDGNGRSDAEKLVGREEVSARTVDYQHIGRCDMYPLLLDALDLEEAACIFAWKLTKFAAITDMFCFSDSLPFLANKKISGQFLEPPGAKKIVHDRFCVGLQTFTPNDIGGTKLRWKLRRERKETLVVSRIRETRVGGAVIFSFVLAVKRDTGKEKTNTSFG